ncbi:hypothetical protein KFE94_03095 [bacterium SCSIO 12643]|nr:hypothetical protein KFE94_03095 [bacterium SCSIO 12643]
MELVLGIFLVWATVFSKHRILFFVTFFSLFADVLRINVVGSMLSAHFVGFLVLPFVFQNRAYLRELKLIRTPLFILIILYLVSFFYFGVFDPWIDISGLRSWGQQSFGRSLISISRLISEISIFLYIYLIIRTGKVDKDLILKYLKIMLVVGFVVAVLDRMVLGHRIVETLFYFRADLANRFIGLNGEPKVFGRSMSLTIALLIALGRLDKDWPYVMVAAIGLVLSNSASAFVMLFMFLVAVVLLRKNLVLKILMVSMLVVFFFIDFKLIISNLSFLYSKETVRKIEKVVYSEDQEWIENEPFLFKKFDIFDRLALIFFKESPEYLAFGVGPNLVHIPSSKYIPKHSIFYTEKRIDSVPNNMIVNQLSSVGIIGLIIWAWFFFRTNKIISLSVKQDYIFIFYTGIIFGMVFFSVHTLYIIAIALGASVKDMNSVVNYERG